MAAEPLTGRGVPLAHAMVTTVNENIVQMFVLAVWMANSDIPTPTHVVTDMQSCLFDGAQLGLSWFQHLRGEAFRPMSRFWCTFHVLRAWKGRLVAHGALMAKMRALMYLPTKEQFDACLAALRVEFANVEVPLGKAAKGSWWAFFDKTYNANVVCISPVIICAFVCEQPGFIVALASYRQVGLCMPVVVAVRPTTLWRASTAFTRSCAVTWRFYSMESPPCFCSVLICPFHSHCTVAPRSRPWRAAHGLYDP